MVNVVPGHAHAAAHTAPTHTWLRSSRHKPVLIRTASPRFCTVVLLSLLRHWIDLLLRLKYICSSKPGGSSKIGCGLLQRRNGLPAPKNDHVVLSNSDASQLAAQRKHGKRKAAATTWAPLHERPCGTSICRFAMKIVHDIMFVP